MIPQFQRLKNTNTNNVCQKFLDYGDVIYHILATKCKHAETFKLNHHLEKIEYAQYSAALAIIGAWNGTSQEKLGNELGWKSHNLSCWSQRLVLFFKFLNSLTPQYTRQPIRPLMQSKYCLHRPHIIGQIPARSTSSIPSLLSKLSVRME